MTGNISEFERQEAEEKNTRDFFAEDNFKARRSGAGPRNYGNAYDPESLITGAEVAAGKTFYDQRVWPSPLSHQLAVEGLLTPEQVAIIAPR